MEIREFYTLVLHMRHAQREYFDKRDKYSLFDAKRLERQVDEELSKIFKPYDERG